MYAAPLTFTNPEPLRVPIVVPSVFDNVTVPLSVSAAAEGIEPTTFSVAPLATPMVVLAIAPVVLTVSVPPLTWVAPCRHRCP